MDEVTMTTDNPKELIKLEQIASMLLTAKAHGHAEIRITVREGIITFGSIELKSKWD